MLFTRLVPKAAIVIYTERVNVQDRECDNETIVKLQILRRFQRFFFLPFPTNSYSHDEFVCMIVNRINSCRHFIFFFSIKKILSIKYR